VSEHHILPKSTYYAIFAVLMILLIVTVGVAFVQLGPLNIYVAMAIAISKAVVIILYFMHVRYSSKLVWIFASAGFVWLIILIALTMSDYVSRDWLPIPTGWQ
jgi:cytochrome c oxidase subunit IV